MRDIICIVEGISESQLTVVRWLKQVGDEVKRDEPICEVSTEKATIEIASPADGVLASIEKKESELASPGDLLGRIDKQRLVDQIEVSIVPEPPDNISDHFSLLHTDTTKVRCDKEIEKLIPHTPMRRTVAKRVTNSLLNTAPHVTAVFEIDMSATLKELHKRKKSDQAMSLMPFIIKASSAALKEVPQVNSQWTDQGLLLWNYHHIGFVVSLGSDGLIIPVIDHVEEKNLSQVATEFTQIIAAIKNKTYPKTQSSKGTFSISNYGSLGGLFTAPVIINQPQSAILGLGKIENRVRAKSEYLSECNLEDKIEVVPLAYFSLTIDHRVLDGFHANKFMSKLEYALKNPEVLI